MDLPETGSVEQREMSTLARMGRALAAECLAGMLAAKEVHASDMEAMTGALIELQRLTYMAMTLDTDVGMDGLRLRDFRRRYKRGYD